VIWRSASRSPKYAECIEKAGFDGELARECVGRTLISIPHEYLSYLIL
jgi:hypothetical protein